MLHNARARFILYDALVTRNRVHVIKYKCNVLILVWIFFLHRQKPNIFHASAIKRSAIRLVNNVDFIHRRIIVRHNVLHIHRKKFQMVLAIAIRNNKYNFWCGGFFNVNSFFYIIDYTRRFICSRHDIFIILYLNYNI